MHDLFSPGLLACVGEGRLPTEQELSTLADKVWREALSGRRLGEPRHAVDVAQAALTGQPLATARR